MKANFTFGFLLIIFFIASSCEDEFICERGHGPVEERAFILPAFTAIDVEEGLKVFVRQGSAQTVTVIGQSNIIDELSREVKGDTWKLKYRHCVRRHEEVEVYITIPSITSLKVSGSGNVTIENSIFTELLTLDVSGSGQIAGHVNASQLASEIAGSGEIEVSGFSEKSEVRINGSGNFYGVDLITEESDVTISGSGSAEVFVDGELDVNIKGSGEVRYAGNPKLNSKVTGSGKVRKIN